MARGADGRSWSSLEVYLTGAHFPCGPDEILKYAKKNGAEDRVLDLLGSLPERDYDSVKDVQAGLEEVTHPFRKNAESGRPGHVLDRTSEHRETPDNTG